MIKKTIIPALIGSTFIAGLMFADSANAGFTSCTGTGYDISGAVTPSSGCDILNPIGANVNDSVSGSFSTYTVNVESFFGSNDWLFDGKWNSTTSGFVDTSSYFNFSGGQSSGTFNYVGDTLAAGSFLFVFKDGADTNLVGYLLSAADANASALPIPIGTYETPFTEPPFSLKGGSTEHDISHISVYYHNLEVCTPTDPRCGEKEIPEPVTLALLGLGLAGLGWSRRRQKQ